MLSVVIPTLNAQNHLPKLLAQLKGNVDQIIISDGGSTDSTVSIALAADTRLALGCKGRGWQLARGAKWAAYSQQDEDWLLFLHADNRLSENWLEAVDDHIKKYPMQAGYFKFKIDDKGFWPRLMEKIVALRCYFWQLPYGDQGLLISKALYEEIGGYPRWDLFEDVKIIEALRGKLRMVNAKIYTRADNYKAGGYWRRGLKNYRLYRSYKNGADQEILVKGYYR